MVKHLVAVYEHGILRPLEPLALAEHQRVRLTVTESTAPLSWLSSESVNERRQEMQWLSKESAPYAGQWVALDGSRLLAHGPKIAIVAAAARAAGIEIPFFASVPDDDLPFAGW